MKKLILGLFFALSFSNAQAGFEIENAFFRMESYKALCVDCGTHTYVRGQEMMLNTGNADVDYQNRYLITGSVEINEIDTNTFDMRKTIIPGVTLRMTATGVIADLTITGNAKMRIKGLAGKRIGDLFDTKYVGGKGRVNAIVNLAFMRMVNDKGIRLIDGESWLAFGLSFQAVKIDATLSLNPAVTTIVNTLTQKQTGQTVESKEDVKEILARSVY